MLTSYFTAVTVKMPPVGKAARLARVFMGNLPPRRKNEIAMNYKLLAAGQESASEISVKFKDGTIINIDPLTTTSTEMTELLDRHSRKLKIETSLNE